MEFNFNITDMQLHTEKAYEFIDQYLPKRYAEEVADKLNNKYSKHTIRKTRKDKKRANSEILKALVEISLENKKNLEFLKQL